MIGALVNEDYLFPLRYLNETINCFSNDTEEVSFIVKSDQLYIKNYVQSENGSDNKSVNTQVNFDSDEFNVYEIEKETDITFCLKEFKVLCALCVCECILYPFHNAD